MQPASKLKAAHANYGNPTARGWRVAYQGSSIDLPHQSHTLDLALKASRARCTAPIRLLVNDSPKKVNFSFRTFLPKKVMLGTKFKRCVHYHELRATDCCFLGGFVRSNLSKPCAIPSITFLSGFSDRRWRTYVSIDLVIDTICI